MQFQHPPLQYRGRATTPPLYMGRSEATECEQQQDINFGFMFPRPSVANNQQPPSLQTYSMSRTPMAQLPNPNDNIAFQQTAKASGLSYAETFGSIQVPHSRGAVITPPAPPQTTAMQLPPGNYHQSNDIFPANASFRSSRNASPAAPHMSSLHAPLHPPTTYYPPEGNSQYMNATGQYGQQGYSDDSVQQSLQSMCTKMEADRQRLLQLEREEASLAAEEAAIRSQLLQLDERQQRANDRGQQFLQDWPTLFKLEQWVNETPDLDLSVQVAQLENRCAPLRHRLGQLQQEVHSHTVELQRFEGNDVVRQRIEESMKQILETGKKVEQRAAKVKRTCERFYDAEVQRTRAAKRHLNSVEDMLVKVELFLQAEMRDNEVSKGDGDRLRSESAARSIPPPNRAGSTIVNRVQSLGATADPIEAKQFQRGALVGATPAAAPTNIQRSRLVSFGPSPAIPPRPRLVPSVAPMVPGESNLFPEASFCVALDDDDDDCDPFPVAPKPQSGTSFLATVGLGDDESIAYPLHSGVRPKAGRPQE